MADRLPSDEPDVVEPCAVASVFADGLHAVEVDRRGIAKLTFFMDQRCSYTGAMERCIVERLILPAEVLTEIATRMLAARPAPVAPTSDAGRRAN